LNGLIRINTSSNAIALQFSNIKFTKNIGGQYCTVKNVKSNIFEIRKSDKFIGRKIYPMKCGAVYITLPRKILSKELLMKISSRATPIKIELIPEDWDLTIDDLFSQKEEGELAEALSEYGNIEKPSVKEIKTDIIFIKNGYKVPVEITKAHADKEKGRNRSTIKSFEIASRLYFLIKWNFKNNTPAFLVLDKDWTQLKWINDEKEFLESNKCFIIFTDFEKENWSREVAKSIYSLLSINLGV